MPKTVRQTKITFGEIRASGVRGVLVYCADYRCSHSIAMSADRWPDDVRLSDIELRFTCQACGQRGADVRPRLEFGRRICVKKAGRANSTIRFRCPAGANSSRSRTTS
jgi:hypothetical protein